MSEPAAAPASTEAASAGRLLREAREKQGLHIAALAAAIKVSPKKLELLESDRFDELPDITFTRALAQTVCRALKTDPAAVMRLLPPPAGQGLENVGEGLNAPFRERPGALVQRDLPAYVSSPMFWITVLILVAAVAVYFFPINLTGLANGRTPPPAGLATRPAAETGMPPEASASAAPPAGSAVASQAVASERASSASDLASAPTLTRLDASVEPAASAVVTPVAAAVMAASAAIQPGVLQLRTSAPSWVEVTDGRGHPLVSRLLQPGEEVGLDGEPPFRLKIGNASGTQLTFRGQPTELQAFTHDNVARLELK
jgi:cytoskeleton protein RodZ